MTWDWEFAWRILPTLLGGLRETAVATVIGTLIALALGLMISFVQFRDRPISSRVIAGYIYVIRGTPFLVQLYFIFFVLPEVGILLAPMQAGSIALGVMFSPYFAETFRAGLQSVPKGQWEAARALNYSTTHTWVRIALPQAFRPVAPALGNYMNSMFKVSALTFAISVKELFGTGVNIGNDFFRYLEPMTMVAALYLAVSIPVSVLISHLQRRQSHKFS